MKSDSERPNGTAKAGGDDDSSSDNDSSSDSDSSTPERSKRSMPPSILPSPLDLSDLKPSFEELEETLPECWRCRYRHGVDEKFDWPKKGRLVLEISDPMTPPWTNGRLSSGSKAHGGPPCEYLPMNLDKTHR